jgi:hypothetical protein
MNLIAHSPHKVTGVQQRRSGLQWLRAIAASGVLAATLAACASSGSAGQSATSAATTVAASTTAAANDMVHNLLAHFSPDRIAMARERMKLSSSRSIQLDAHGIPGTSELKHASQGCVPYGLGGARKPSISHARPRHNAAVGTFHCR